VPAPQVLAYGIFGTATTALEPRQDAHRAARRAEGYDRRVPGGPQRKRGVRAGGAALAAACLAAAGVTSLAPSRAAPGPRPPAQPRGCAAAPGDGLTLANVAAHGSRVVGVGSDGLIATSTGGGRWTVRASRVGHALRGVVWTGTRWVVVGDAGTILSSADGTGWQPAAGSIPAVGLRAIAARPGLVVAAGSGGTLLSSPDGEAWTVEPSGTAGILWGGTRAGSQLLISGQAATVIASADGSHWTPVPTFPRPTDNQVAPRPFLWQLAAAGERLVAVGDFGSVLDGSAAGLPAARSPTDEILRGVTFSRGVGVVVGSSGAILRSTGPGRWRAVRSPTTVDLRGVASTGSSFVAVGDESTIISSHDGRRWRTDATAMPCALLSVARGAGRDLAVGGSGRVLGSTDGRRWRALARPTREDLYALDYGPGGFVAVGAKGTVLQSADGRRWALRHAATRLNIHAVTWTGHEYLLGGDRGRLFSSADGVRWRAVPFPGFHSIRDFATAAGVTVAAGAGTVARRGAGGGWTLEPLGLGRFQTSIAAGAGRFVIVGHNGEALVSTDGGRSWSAGDTGVEINLDRVVYADGRFIATGEGEALASGDGLRWSLQTLPTARSIRSIAVAGSDLVAVGDGNVILRSSDGGRHWAPQRAP
jgi:photosystem II stability/assembly factor-like uncharacterized protein